MLTLNSFAELVVPGSLLSASGFACISSEPGRRNQFDDQYFSLNKPLIAEVYPLMSDDLSFDPSTDYEQPPEGYRRVVGVYLQAAASNEYNRFGMPPIGPVVHKVILESPAHTAGVLPGDMILEVDGTTTDAMPGSSKDLVAAVIRYMNRPSSARIIMLRIRRNQEELVLKVVL